MLLDKLEPFIWGKDGKPMTPEQVARERELAALMGERSVDTSPVGHWTQGATRLVDALGGVMKGRRADRAETEGMERGQAAMSPVLAALTQQSSGGMAAPVAGGGGGMEAYRNAISSIESGGNYQAVGPRNDRLGRALGRYQIMEANIGPWSRAALGREVTPDEFLNSPEIQDAIFDHRFGGYVDRFGPEGAAQAWFAGEGGVGKMDRKDVLGTSVADYTRKFNQFLGGLPGNDQFASLDAGTMTDAAPEQFAGLQLSPIENMPDPGIQAQGDPLQTMPDPGFVAQGNPIQNMPHVHAAPHQPPQMPQVPAQQPPMQPDMQMHGDPMQAGPMANPGIAQALAGGQQQQSPGVMEALLGAMQDPWAAQQYGPVLQALLGQQIQQQNMQHQMGLRQQDPMYQAQLQQAQLQLEQMMNPPPPDPVTVAQGAALVDPRTGQPIFQNAPNAPSAVQEYEFYAQQQLQNGQAPLSFGEWDMERRRSGATNVNVGGEGAPGLGKLSSDYGYVLDPATGQPVIDPETGLPQAAAIPGSPAWQERRDAEEAAAAGKRNAVDYARTVTQDIGIADDFLSQLGPMSSMDGVIGANLRNARAGIPGTPEYNMSKFVESALSNLTLDTMNRMRETSAAGATGFGNMSDRQLRVIQGVLGQWEAGLPIEEQRYILHRLGNFYMDVQVGTRAEREQAVRDGRMTAEENAEIESLYYPETRDVRGQRIEQDTPAVGPTGAPQPGQVIDGYRFRGGDPGDQRNWEPVQ